MSQLTDQMNESAAWLCSAQTDSGGWGETPQAEHVSALNTAEAIAALIQADGEAIGTDAVRRGVDFLRSSQVDTGTDRGAWLRNVDETGQHDADVVRTASVLEALMLAEVPTDDPLVTQAVAWVVDVRSKAGGWGCARNASPRLFPTCQALLGLLAVWKASAGSPVDGETDRDALRDLIRSEIDLLLRDQRAAGFFSANDVASHLAAPHTIYAVLVLQRARVFELAGNSKPEHRALDWLLASQDDARRLVSERFDLSAQNHYDFLYVTDSLLIRALNDSDRKLDQQSVLYRAALYSVKDRIEPAHGACYGYRPFTWATSRAIAGISAAATSESAFPDRPTESNKKIAFSLWVNFGLLFALVLSALLGFFGNFSPELFGFFSLVVFVLLLLSGAIGTQDFMRLVGLVFGRAPGSGAAPSPDKAALGGTAESSQPTTGH